MHITDSPRNISRPWTGFYRVELINSSIKFWISKICLIILYNISLYYFHFKPSSHDELFKIDKIATTTNMQIVPNIEKYPSIWIWHWVTIWSLSKPYYKVWSLNLKDLIQWESHDEVPVSWQQYLSIHGVIIDIVSMVPQSATVKKFCQNVCIQFRTGSIATSFIGIPLPVAFSYTIWSLCCQNSSFFVLIGQFVQS